MSSSVRVEDLEQRCADNYEDGHVATINNEADMAKVLAVIDVDDMPFMIGAVHNADDSDTNMRWLSGEAPNVDYDQLMNMAIKLNTYNFIGAVNKTRDANQRVIGELGPLYSMAMGDKKFICEYEGTP